MPASPAWKKDVRRASYGTKKANHPDNPDMPAPGPANERQPLLDHGGNGANGAATKGHSTWKSFFSTREDTPGMDSDKLFVKWPARCFNVTKITLLSNYVNVLLVFVPLGIMSGKMGWNPTTTFILNFFAIVPLAAVLSFATEEISIKLGETLGGLMNATFGNAVELIVSVVALKNGEIRIVQSSMLGSILSNILLVLGCCFLAGGIKNSGSNEIATGIEQKFNTTAAGTMSSLMIVAAASLIIPATLYAVLPGSAKDNDAAMLILSHGTAIIMLVLYVMYLGFQLKTHAALFTDDHKKNKNKDPAPGAALTPANASENDLETASPAASGPEPNGDDEELPAMSPWAAAVVLLLTTLAVSVCAEYLVDSIDSLVETAHISKTFVGLVLIPIVGNAAEHVTAIVVALKDKMDLAMGVAVGSSLQIALLVTPFLVILGWIIGQPMTLHFQTFETVVFFLSVLVVTYVIQDGRSNYLEGAMLLGMYIIIALAFLVYPDNAVEDPGNMKVAVRALAGGWYPFTSSA